MKKKIFLASFLLGSFLFANVYACGTWTSAATCTQVYVANVSQTAPATYNPEQ